ncbi:hypothetical protein RZS08_41965, partial [Arthrospira platensis SPKY1]|nr:hypothetical protein [Arthrospira platensis SPKY1]
GGDRQQVAVAQLQVEDEGRRDHHGQQGRPVGQRRIRLDLPPGLRVEQVQLGGGEGLALERLLHPRPPAPHQFHRPLLLGPALDLGRAVPLEQVTADPLRDRHRRPRAALAAETLGAAMA